MRLHFATFQHLMNRLGENAEISIPRFCPEMDAAKIFAVIGAAVIPT